MVTEKEPCIYLLSGEQASVEKAAAQIKSKFISPKNESCDLNTFWGDEASSDEIIEALKTVPFASRKRLVILKRADALPEEDQEKLASYLKKPSTYSVVILVAAPQDLIKALAYELKESGKILDFRKQLELKPLSGFELVDAIAARDAAKALGMLNRLLKDGKSAVEIIGLLGWYFSKKKKDGEALKMISEVDITLKTKSFKETAELEVLVIKLCRKAFENA